MKKLALFFFFTSFVFSLFAQTLPNQCTVYKPSVLITRMLRQSDVNHLLSSPDYCQAESSTGKKTFWIVYSDRNGNAAFTSSTSLEVISSNDRTPKSPSFLERTETLFSSFSLSPTINI